MSRHTQCTHLQHLDCDRVRFTGPACTCLPATRVRGGRPPTNSREPCPGWQQPRANTCINQRSAESALLSNHHAQVLCFVQQLRMTAQSSRLSSFYVPSRQPLMHEARPADHNILRQLCGKAQCTTWHHHNHHHAQKQHVTHAQCHAMSSLYILYSCHITPPPPYV